MRLKLSVPFCPLIQSEREAHTPSPRGRRNANRKRLSLFFPQNVLDSARAIFADHNHRLRHPFAPFLLLNQMFHKYFIKHLSESAHRSFLTIHPTVRFPARGSRIDFHVVH